MDALCIHVHFQERDIIREAFSFFKYANVWICPRFNGICCINS